MLAVAVGWQVYALTRDPLALGLVGLSEFLPFILLVLVGGHVADRAAAPHGGVLRLCGPDSVRGRVAAAERL